MPDMIRPRTVPVKRLTLTMVFLALLFLPRLINLDAFYIQDEMLWLSRSHYYIEKMMAADWHGLGDYPPFSTHPGVTVMSTVGPVISLYAFTHDLANNYEQWSVIDKRQAAVWGRAVVGLVSTLVLIAFYWHLRQLKVFQANPWLAAGLTIFFGLEPAVWAMSRTVHLDSLLSLLLVTTFASAVKTREQPSLTWASITGLWSGVSLLTKIPALIFFPFIIFIFMLRPRADWKQTLKVIMTWAVTTGLTFFVLWPALWPRPIAMLQWVLGRAAFHVESPEAYVWPGIHLPFFIFSLSAVTALGCCLYIGWRLYQLWRGQWNFDLILLDSLFLAGLGFGLFLVYTAGDHARRNIPAVALLSLPGLAGWYFILKKFHLTSAWTITSVLLIHGLLVVPWFPHLPSFHNPLIQSDDGKRLLVDIGNGTRLVADELNHTNEPIVVATSLPGLIQAYIEPDSPVTFRRLPKNGLLTNLEPDVTHLIIPLSFPARINFDATAKTMTEQLTGFTPVKIISARDVPLFAIYRVIAP